MSRLQAAYTKNRHHIKSLAVYLAIAAVGFTVNFTSRVIYTNMLGISFKKSIIIAYLTGMVVAFVLTKLFAFDARNSGQTQKEAIKFFIVSMVALGVTYVISLVTLRVNDWLIYNHPAEHQKYIALFNPWNFAFLNRELISHFIGMCFGFFANYFGHKFLSFRSTGFRVKL